MPDRRNRFNRPITPEQIESLVEKLRAGAQSRKDLDPEGSHIMFLSLHVLGILWREVAFHDIVAEDAEATLHTVEQALLKIAENSEIARLIEAKRVLAEVQALKSRVVEVQNLKARIQVPTSTFKNWEAEDIPDIGQS